MTSISPAGRPRSARLFVPLGLAAAAVAMSAAPSRADLVLTLQGSPDILAQAISVNYNYNSITNTGQFTANGSAINLKYPDSVISPIVGGTFALNATLDGQGVLSSGALTIGGTIPSLGITTGTLLTGNVTGLVGEAGASGALEFAFTPTGGNLAGLYGNLGGVILASTGYSGSFATNFSSNFTTSADVGAVVPEPATLISGGFGAGCLGLIALIRRRRAV